MKTTHFSVIILGAGIGGYYTFETLKKTFLASHKDANILLIDRHPFTQFLPIMHQIVSHRICPNTAHALFTEIADNRAETLRATIQKIDAEHHSVETSEGTFTFDYLVTAMGSEVAYFGTPGAEKYSYRVNALPEAMRLRDAIDSIKQNKEPKHICIVGGSYTGVEVAGEIADRIGKNSPHSITLLDGSQILSSMPKRVQRIAKKRLTKLNVTIKENTRATEVTEKTLSTNDGKILPSNITVWAGGCKNIGNLFFSENDTQNGRVLVDNFLRLKNFPHIYCIGDICGATHGIKQCPLPQNGSVAHEEAVFVAEHIAKLHKKEESAPFTHKTADTIVMSIGAWYGIFSYKSFAFGGIIPWLMRQAIYTIFIPTTKNKWRFLREFWTGA